MKNVAGLFLVAAFSVLLVACGGGAAQAKPVSFSIDMTEYSFKPDRLDLKVGQEVTLNLTNAGQLQHEIMFGREVHEDANGRPAGYIEDMFAAGGVAPTATQSAEATKAHEAVDHGGGFMLILPPGATGKLTFEVTQDMVGEWEMGCFEQDGVHYDAGMKGAVTVTE